MTLHQFNLNETVRVRLTEVGRQELRRQHDELYQHVAARGGKMPDYVSVTEVDGWSRWQLWCLMQHLGPMIHMGGDPPFETTIVFECAR